MSQSTGNEQRVELQVIGGFLGSGKTTLIERLARHHAARGRRVGIITNDQAQGLVDTQTFRSQGWTTEEIAGGCFCCKFDDLIAAADRILAIHRPDVLFCEPVGSCTDIVATVIRPLQQHHGDRFRVAPYVALLDPQRALEALSGTGRSGFTAKVTYIFQMQQNEADIIAVNKADQLSPGERRGICERVAHAFPNSRLVLVSARTGEGLDALTDLIGNPSTQVASRGINVDYDTYAEGEAALGWLNAEYELTTKSDFSMDDVLVVIASGIREAIARQSAEPAHLKLSLRSRDGALARCSMVTSAIPAELSQRSEANAESATLLINARVEWSPESLTARVQEVLGATLTGRGISVAQTSLQAFRPGRPVPTHRMEKC